MTNNFPKSFFSWLPLEPWSAALPLWRVLSRGRLARVGQRVATVGGARWGVERVVLAGLDVGGAVAGQDFPVHVASRLGVDAAGVVLLHILWV